MIRSLKFAATGLLFSSGFVLAGESGVAKIQYESDRQLEIRNDGSRCRLTHQIDDNFEVETFAIADDENAVRIDIRSGTDAPVSDMRIDDGSRSYSSLSLGEKITMEAEANFGQLSDDEYFAMHDEAEAAEGQNYPGFSSYSAVAEGKDFASYAQSIRANERFPPLRTANVAVSINNIAVRESNDDNRYSHAGLHYSGPCLIAIMIE